MAEEQNPLELDFFKKNGYFRRRCTNCHRFFWTSDDSRETCGDPPCDHYTFIGKPPTSRRYTLDEMRQAFIGFFKKNDHTFLKPYPVVPRWRDDVLLVNASIYDFQPQVTSGVVPPPANPIVMSQPSIRMIDIDLVGTTGRHLTTFEMMCHDSFNNGKKTVYWKEETVAYCQSFLTDELGIDPALITYKEKPWSGGGNGGNAFEVLVEGLEVATLVFMDMIIDPDGETEIDGQRYSPMDMKIVDTGYGLERLAWLSQGTSTVYEAIYPGIVEHVTENSEANLIDHRILKLIVQNFARHEGRSEKEILAMCLPEIKKLHPEMSGEELEREFHTLRSAFIVADHTRTLLLLFSDYVIPSNIKAGYLVRLLIRRTLRNMELIGYRGTIKDLINMHWKSLGNIISNFPSDFIDLMLEEESRKYSETLQKGKGIVERLINKQKRIGLDDLTKLYDSSGLHPDFVSSIVREKTGEVVEIPDDFHSRVISLHEGMNARKAAEERFPDIKTRPLYYDDVKMSDFNAIVLESGDGYIIPNQTAFYPEGGGQPTDLGYFDYKGGKVEVLKSERHGDTIVHRIRGEIPKGARIMGHIDTFRRHRLMAHHSATHLILGVMKEILGPHVWQFGVQKGVETSRIDITHYRKITEEEIQKIEKRCSELIREGRNIRVKNVDWNKAIAKYGFTVFQGGVPLSSKLRLVEIEGVDVEGCGGTHMSNTSELGFVKIVNTESIQEGIQRITFVAGEAAVEYVQSLYSAVREVQASIPADIRDIPGRVRSLLTDNIELNKEKENLLKRNVNEILEKAKTFSYGWGEAAVLRSKLRPEGMKLLTSALFSRKYGLSIVVNDEGDGTFTCTIISKTAGDSREIGGKLPESFRQIKASAGYYAASSGENISENLIKKILDSL